MRSLKTEDSYRLIRNYISAFEAELSDSTALVRANYFEAIFEMFDEVLRATMTSHGQVKQQSIQESIRPIAKIDFSGRGKLTKKNFTDLMQSTFRRRVALSSDML
jgi:DNA sulfur modification protein DndB